MNERELLTQCYPLVVHAARLAPDLYADLKERIDAALHAPAPAKQEQAEARELVKRLNELEAKATPGPWQAVERGTDSPYIFGNSAGSHVLARPPILSGIWPTHAEKATAKAEDETYSNIEFVAALRNAWPEINAALLARQIEAQQEEWDAERWKSHSEPFVPAAIWRGADPAMSTAEFSAAIVTCCESFGATPETAHKVGAEMAKARDMLISAQSGKEGK